jgi:hypothetical protein
MIQYLHRLRTGDPIFVLKQADGIYDNQKKHFVSEGQSAAVLPSQRLDYQFFLAELFQIYLIIRGFFIEILFHEV